MGINTAVEGAVTDKLKTPAVLIQKGVEEWLNTNFDKIMLNTETDYSKDVIDELYFSSVGNTVDLSGYPVLFRKERKHPIKLILDKNQSGNTITITVNDVSDIHGNESDYYAFSNNLTTSFIVTVPGHV